MFTTPKTHTVPFIACYYKPSLRQAQSLLYLCLHRSVVKLLPDACTGGREGDGFFPPSSARSLKVGSERAMERRPQATSSLGMHISLAPVLRPSVGHISCRTSRVPPRLFSDTCEEPCRTGITRTFILIEEKIHHLTIADMDLILTPQARQALPCDGPGKACGFL